MNEYIIEFMSNLDYTIKKAEESLQSIDSNKKSINNLFSVANKLDDNINSLILIKDYELNLLVKDIHSMQDIIDEIKLIRYLIKGIVNEGLNIDISENQKMVYDKFKGIINKEKEEFEQYDFQSLKLELKKLKKIYNMLKTRKPDFTVDMEFLDAFLDEAFTLEEKNCVIQTIKDINNKKNTKKI